MYNNNNRRHHSHGGYEHRDRHEKHEHVQPRKYSKSMILLKSTVFALFIVLVVSLAAFEIIKHRKESSNSVVATKCDKMKVINIPQNIESLKVNDGVITVLTKASSKGEQEIIRFSADCGRELNKIIFKVGA
jgi:hypothetical protein